MFYFENDYCEGAHPAILQKLMETNFEKVPGYGTDPYCASAEGEDPRCLCLPGSRCVPSSPAAPRPTPSSSRRCCTGGKGVRGRCHGPCQRPRGRGHRVHRPQGAWRLPATRTASWSAADVRELLRHLLRRRQPRPHGLPRHGVHLSPHRSTAPCTPRPSCRRCTTSARTYHMPLFVDGARLGYGLAAEGTRRHPARPGPPGRCVLHRRHQGGRPLRRGRGLPPWRHRRTS